MNKFKIILVASIAAALTLSCSILNDESKDDSSSSNNSGKKSSSSKDGPSGGDSSDSNNGNNSGSGGATETYTLTEQDEERFSYFVPYEYSRCEESGLETTKDSIEMSLEYSIDNNIMTWGDESNMWGELIDTLIFKGSSNELKGTWTRTRNKATSCYLEEYGYEPGMVCKRNYDITKVVFTDSKITFTRDECLTDTRIELDYGNGWKDKVVNCNTIEITKGSDKITKKITKTGEETSYKGQSCKFSEPTKAQKQTACKKAVNEYPGEDEYGYPNYGYAYYDLLDKLYESYYDCLADILPEDFLENDYCDYNPDDSDCWGEEGSLKAKAKTSKIKPLLKKKNRR